MTSKSKVCDICHYWYFLDQGFKFPPDVFNGSHDVLMMSMNHNNILNIHSADYCCILVKSAKVKL